MTSVIEKKSVKYSRQKILLLECLTCQTIDPCTKEYYKHLDRDEETGNIIFKTELGKYMYNKMKLYLLCLVCR